MKEFIIRKGANFLSNSLIIKGILFGAISVLVINFIACSNEDHKANNDFFFQDINKEYKYSVRLFFEDDIAELPVKLQYLKSYDDGDVYSLSIQHEDCPERYYYDVLDRFDIGTFYVTDDEIYLLLQCKDVPDEEAFLSDGFLVCGSDDMDENIDGEHLQIKNEGDTCYFYMDNTLTESGYYSSYGWTKGKGLTYFRSGYGAEGDPIEIELKD